MSTAEQTADSPVEAAVVQDMREAGIMPRREATVMELAAVIAGSRDFPDVRTPEKAAIRILAGREMGVGPVASVIGVRINAGRVSMDATLMAGCIKRSERYDYIIKEHTAEKCILEFYDLAEVSRMQPKVSDVAGLSEFSMDDARKAGLANKETWKAYPRNMLFARALSNGARWYCAGIFGGSIYTHEELGIAVDEEGRAVEVNADGNGNSNGAGNELCTRDQRQQICRLVEAVGDSMPQFMAKMGIKLLDELSGYEAAKEIKRLHKRLEKTSGWTDQLKQESQRIREIEDAPNGVDATKAGVPAGCNSRGLVPDNSSLSAPAALTPAQQTIADGFDESRRPSTPEQRDAILGLAQWLEPDEAACCAGLQEALAKRNCRKLAELNHLQAAALIEALQAKIKETKEAGQDCPFDPSPQLPGMS